MKQEDAITSAYKTSVGYRVLLVDDHPLTREVLRAILAGHAEVIGEASDGMEAVGMASDLRPDVILMDVNMPRMDGIQATRIIKARQPEVTVIGLSGNDSPLVKEEMKEAGAASFLSKGGPAEQLYDAISAHREAIHPALSRLLPSRQAE